MNFLLKIVHKRFTAGNFDSLTRLSLTGDFCCSALALVREDGRCQDLFGPTIAGFGEETSRGRRRHVAHHKYEKDGRQRIRVLFHLKVLLLSSFFFLNFRRNNISIGRFASDLSICGFIILVDFRENVTRALHRRKWNNEMVNGSGGFCT